MTRGTLRLQRADIARAEKKLRQAELFLGHLVEASHEMVNEVAKGCEKPERLESYYSACLSAAQSVYTVLEENGGSEFNDLQKAWRKTLTNEVGRIGFDRMKRLRGEDVHFGVTGATPLPKYIEQQNFAQYPYHWQHHNAALLGEMVAIEETNPDGQKVTGHVLRGTFGLYLDHNGGRLEATTVCRHFIDQLRSLLDATRAAFFPDSPNSPNGAA